MTLALFLMARQHFFDIVAHELEQGDLDKGLLL
jgi:hypothetical protein